MNLSIKRCLFGMMAWAAIVGAVSAQEQPTGSVQLGGPTGEPLPPPMSMPDQSVGQTALGGPGMTEVDQIFSARGFVDNRAGGLHGYDAGYTNVGAFLPWSIEGDEALLYIDARGLITYNGGGGANVGLGWRWHNSETDRITGLAAWWDFDSGHERRYQQVGLSFESLGRFLDYRVNGYIPVGKKQHMLDTSIDSTSALFVGSALGFLRTTRYEQSYTGVDFEMGGPMPLIGRYGFNGYVGGYHFLGNGNAKGSYTGVSGRFQAQINEDLQLGLQLTDDHEFGLSTQFQAMISLPNGRPSRWMRNLRMFDRMTMPVIRQNRVMTHVDNVVSVDPAINTKTGLPYFVAQVDPNAALNGDGSIGAPLQSIAAYNALPESQRQRYDIIYVRPRSDATSTNLDTADTLTLFGGQRLLSTSVAHTITAANFPGRTFALPGFTGGALPQLINSGGGDVITLAPNTAGCIEVSGFDITANPGASGIRGDGNTFVLINRNDIHGGQNGVFLTNLSGTIANGTAAQILDNRFHNNLEDGFRVANNGTAPLDLVYQGNASDDNGDDGLDVSVASNSTVTLLIDDSATSQATFERNGDNGLEITANVGTVNGSIRNSSFSGNTGDGLHLDSVGSIINFKDALLGYAITNNDFSGNTGSGIEMNNDNSDVMLNIFANRFGDPINLTPGNADDGIRIGVNNGTSNIMIGGMTAAEGNVFVGNLENGIVLNYTGASVNDLDIGFNTLTIGGGGVAGTGGNLYLTGHDVTLHGGQNGYDDVILDFLRGVGTANVIPRASYDLAVLGNGVGFWNFSNGTQMANGLASTTFFDLDTVATNPALWATIFANDGVLILSHENCGGCDVTDAGVATIVANSALFQAAINSGVDIWAESAANNAQYYNWLPPGAVATGAPIAGSSGFSATPAGTAIGIIDTPASSMINGFATHNQFPTLDPAFTIFETFDDPFTPAVETQTVSVGARNVTISGGGFGGVGTDGIRVNLEDTAVVRTGNIHDNTITGYDNGGIHVSVNDNANYQNMIIDRNTTNGSGRGIFVERSGSGSLNGVITNNIVDASDQHGIVVSTSGTDTPATTLTVSDNTVTNSGTPGGLGQPALGGNGFYFVTADASVLVVDGDRNVSTNNRANGFAFETFNTSRLIGTFRNTISMNNTTNGLSAVTRDNSILDLTFTSPADPLFTAEPRSTFSENTLDGMFLNPGDTSLLVLNVDNTDITNNRRNGVQFNREGAGLFLSTITNSAITNNTNNGILVTGLGSDPADTNQQLPGTPNTLTLTNDVVDNNGSNGLRADIFGDMVFVLNANSTSFSNNTRNGIRVQLGPNGQFGDIAGGTRSILDGVTINDNAENGIFLLSFLSPVPQTDPNSITFMEINSNTSSTSINSNGFNGILGQWPGGLHDVIVRGDTDPALPANQTVIQSNGQDGIHVDTGLFATSTFTVDNVLIGGGTAALGNQGDGIDFAVTSQFTVVDTETNTTTNWTFNTAGVGTLNVNESIIRNNAGHGINLLGMGLRGFDATPFRNNGEDASGQINANVTLSSILENGQNGVNIEIAGHMGGDHRNFAFPNRLVFDQNRIASNAQHGFFFEANAGEEDRVGPSGRNTHREVRFNDPQPTNPNFPFDPTNLAFVASDWNTGTNTSILSGGQLSDYLNLRTAQSTDLVFTNNQVEFNGTSTVFGEGVYMRVGTNSYVSADVRNNRFTGNLANDLKIESFRAYNRATGAAIPNVTSVAANPGPDIVWLDDTAQLDLRFTGNTGNSINIVDPFNNFGGGRLGNSTPNGAFYEPDFFKGGNNFPRLAQLFQVDDGLNLDATNTFISGGVTQSSANSFFFAEWHLRTVADPFFPDPNFPEDFFTDPGDPFLQ